MSSFRYRKSLLPPHCDRAARTLILSEFCLKRIMFTKFMIFLQLHSFVLCKNQDIQPFNEILRPFTMAFFLPFTTNFMIFMILRLMQHIFVQNFQLSLIVLTALHEFVIYIYEYNELVSCPKHLGKRLDTFRNSPMLQILNKAHHQILPKIVKSKN